MSCGCSGQLPHSIVVRMEAARIAAGTGPQTHDRFTAMATAVHSFLIGGLGDGGEKSLDAKPKHTGDGAKGHDPQSVTLRNSFLNAPLAALITLEEAIVDHLERVGVEQIGSLAQMPAGAMAAAGLASNQVDKVIAELEARGLWPAMNMDQLREWIRTGDGRGEGQASKG